MNNIVKQLKRFGQIDDMQDIHLWDDLDDKSKLYYLWESEIDGMCNIDDFLSYGECLLPTSKKDMVSTIRDELDNLMYGNDVEDTNHYTIKYADGTLFHTEDAQSDKFKKMGIIWICPTGGITLNRYFVVNNAAKRDMMEYMGFNEIIRGEIKGIDFNYREFEKMADDWI